VTSHALAHVAELAFPATALLVTMEFFGRGEYAEIGLATFISSLLFGAAAIPSGRLVDRLGARAVLLIFLFGTGASLALLSQMRSFPGFTAGLALVGCFSGLYHPAGTTMISLGIKEHGKAMGAHGVGGNLGLALTPFVAAALAGTMGWRWAYAALGSIPIILGLLVIAARVNVGRAEEPGSGSGKDNQSEKPYLLIPLVIMFFMAVFNGMTYRGLMTFLPSYFAERVHLSWLPLHQVTVGGTMTTAILLLGVVGQFIGGNLADRFNKEKVYTVIFFITCPLLLLLGSLSNLPLILVTAAFAFLYFMNQPVGNAMIPRYASPAVRGMVFGLFFFMAFGAGSIMSWIAGIVGERFELNRIFIMLAASTLISALLGLLLVAKTRDLD
jgi:MFS family permease